MQAKCRPDLINLIRSFGCQGGARSRYALPNQVKRFCPLFACVCIVCTFILAPSRNPGTGSHRHLLCVHSIVTSLALNDITLSSEILTAYAYLWPSSQSRDNHNSFILVLHTVTKSLYQVSTQTLYRPTVCESVYTSQTSEGPVHTPILRVKLGTMCQIPEMLPLALSAGLARYSNIRWGIGRDSGT